MGDDVKKERPDHARKPRRFGPSKAMVQPAQGQTENQVVALIRTILGRPRATLQYAANLAGAPDDALVTVAVSPMHGSHIIEIQAESASVKLRILLYRRFDGKPILENDQIDVLEGHQRQGIGARLLARQVEHGIRPGVVEIQGYAVRDDRTGHVGYWVWPLLGFDGNLVREVLDKLPPEFAKARKISHLMSSEQGRRWWFENGDSFTINFDLRPRSQDLRWLRAYLRGRGMI
jgi:GNAT superfamily N-acetyltransferase